MIILTGASGGIGNAVAKELSVIDSIICLYNSHQPKDILTSETVKLVQLDITKEADVKKFVADHQSILQKVTIIHFATASIDGLVMTFPFESWKKVMDVNINGNFLLTANLLPFMIKSKWGRIIHISSVAGKTGVKGAAAYSMSKTALEGWSKTLSKEYAGFNITSNILNLGYFEVGLINTLTDEARNKVLTNIPSHKLGKTANITNAISFLINSDYVNGAFIDIHGGL